MSPQEQVQGREPAQPTGLWKNQHLLIELLPKVPLMLRVAALHMLRLSQQSKYLDLRTELIIAVIRSFLNPSKPLSITSTQRITSQNPEIKGKIWISTYACPPPAADETGLQDALAAAVDGLRGPKIPQAAYQMSEPATVEAEWTGYRADATPASRLPPVSERELYAEMMKEVKSPVTVLYFHGGAYYLLDPATYRPTTKKLAKLTGGRVYSVRYRLAPQHPFPAALMDALMSYLALLYPPDGAFHEPVKPEHIVFAGDSAGGNLSLALLQLILHLNRHNHQIQWHGTARAIPLPAGVAVNSPWMDVTQSSPSYETNATFDYLPTPAQILSSERRRPPCPAWPANPPRTHLYVADALLAHPLVTLLLAPSWAGAPPVYMCTGWECLADEDRYVARKMWRDGVRVVFEEYEAMAHCFAMVVPQIKEARRCIQGWAGFMKEVVEVGRKGEGMEEKGESRFITVKARTLEEVAIDPRSGFTSGGVSEEEVVEARVWQTIRERTVPEEGVAKL